MGIDDLDVVDLGAGEIGGIGGVDQFAHGAGDVG